MPIHWLDSKLFSAFFAIHANRDNMCIETNIKRKILMKRTNVILDEKLIAAVAMAHEVFLLHNDRDFLPIKKHFGLKTL